MPFRYFPLPKVDAETVLSANMFPMVQCLFLLIQKSSMKWIKHKAQCGNSCAIPCEVQLLSADL